jgi:hypothetical protein
MPITGPQIAAAVFDNVEQAERGWEMLNDADIPSAMITESALGSYSVSLMVERKHLDEAQAVLAPLVGG